MMHGYGMMGYGIGHMWINWLFQILILVVFFMVIWWLFRSSGSFGFKSGESATDILKKRFAAGEIDSKEFERLKKEIEK